MQALQIKPFLSPYPGPCTAPSVLISGLSTYPDLTVGPIPASRIVQVQVEVLVQVHVEEAA